LSEEFSRGAREDLVRATSAGVGNVISQLGYEEMEKPKSGKVDEQKLRPLNEKVIVHLCL